MKNEKIAALKRKIMLRLLAEIAAIFAGFGALYYLFAVLLEGGSQNFFYEILGMDYYSMNSLRSIMIPLTLALSVAAAVYLSVDKLSDYIGELTGSIDSVLSGDEAQIKLPRDLADVEEKLNSIKYSNLKIGQAAKESEQRKNDLIVYLAHDLKTPLTSVIGYLTLLRDESQISDELREKYLSVALDKANRLEDLINEFFEITRFNLQYVSLEPANVNLSIMLRQLADEFYPMLSEKELSVKIDIPEGISVFGDRDKLARVFDNLLRNAISYSFENTDINVICVQEGNNVILETQNHGNVIPKDKLDRIFEQFFRLDASRTSETGGAGLGLAIAKQIVAAHNGSISAKSGSDKTSFSVALPLS